MCKTPYEDKLSKLLGSYPTEEMFIWTLLPKIGLGVGVFSGALITILSSSWLGVWAGFEMNTLCFICLISLPLKYQKEASMKYFIIQAFSSYMLLFSGLFILEGQKYLSVTLSLALLLKSGAAPFHFWYPTVAEELEWAYYWMLSSLQKLSPLVVLMYCMSFLPSLLLYFSLLLSCLVGAYSSFNELALRKLLAYSSIHHLGWIFFPMLEESNIWLIYYLIYCATSGFVILKLDSLSIFSFIQFSSIKLSGLFKVCLVLSLLSLGSFPPLLGFYPKWLLLQESFSWGPMVILYLMLLLSVILLYVYLHFSVGVFLLASYSSFLKKSEVKPLNKVLLTICLLNLFGFYLSSSFSSFLQ